MKSFPSLKLMLVLFLSLILSGVPVAATAGMISTREAVAELTRTETIERIRGYITRSEVQAEMAKHGLAPSEVSMRLASMNSSELRQISEQITQAKAGGEVVVIGLTTILLVVIILMLMGRI